MDTKKILPVPMSASTINLECVRKMYTICLSMDLRTSIYTLTLKRLQKKKKNKILQILF